MLLFTAPSLLWLPAAILLFGLLALFIGRRKSRAVPSIRLWHNHADAASPHRRFIDPLSLLIFLAALLASLILAGPAWQIGPSPIPSPDLHHGSIRTLPRPSHPPSPQQSITEAWVQIPNAAQLPSPLSLKIQAAGAAQEIPLPAPLASPSPASLAAGITIPLPPNLPAVTLRLSSGLPPSTLLAEQRFSNPPNPAPFGLLASPGADPAILHLLSIQAGARPDNPAIQPLVWLVNDPALTPDQIAKTNPQTLIAQPATPLPGITPGPSLEAPPNSPDTPPAGWTPQSDSLPKLIDLSTVRIHRMTRAQLDPTWKILATANGLPWIAFKPAPPSTAGGGAGPNMLWLASNPSTDTDWAKNNPSFVLFFADYFLTQTLPPTRPGQSYDWKPGELTLPLSPSAQIIDFAPWLAAAAVLWLVLAAILFLRRSPH